MKNVCVPLSIVIPPKHAPVKNLVENTIVKDEIL